MSPTATSCGALKRAEISEMRAQGIPTADIATRAGVTRGTLYNALAAWHLTTAKRGGDRRSKYWTLFYREQLAAAIAQGAA